MIIDVKTRSVDWYVLVADDYEPVDSSRLIDYSPAELGETLEWPTLGGF